MLSVAFIPARKGSKGLPGKNKKLFCGKPLIQWSIDQALESGCFDHVVVSSDDEDVIEIAKNYNSKKVIAHVRHEKLAQDDTVIDEVLYDFFARPEHECDVVCLLNPTSPLRLPEDISKMFKYIKMKKYWSVVSVQWCDFIGWVGKPTNKGPICSYNLSKRPNRQTRDDYFLENGSIFWFEHRILMAYGNMIGNPNKVKLYEMPRERSFEIDNEFDFWIAERAYEYQHPSVATAR